MKNKIFLQQTDITTLDIDAIVNAANNSLLGGGGVDGAIHRAAGKELYHECKELNGCSTGDAKITSAYNLPCKYIIHTVGPIWTGGTKNEASLLESAYKRSLEVAVENDIKTIAFPNISTGVFNFPKQKAAVIALNTVINFLIANSKIQKVIFAVYDNENYDIYNNLLKQLDDRN